MLLRREIRALLNGTRLKVEINGFSINGKFIGLELKSKIGKVSLQQYKNGAKITENKGIFAVIDDYDNFLELYNDLIKNKKVIRHTLSFEELSNLLNSTRTLIALAVR